MIQKFVQEFLQINFRINSELTSEENISPMIILELFRALFLSTSQGCFKKYINEHLLRMLQYFQVENPLKKLFFQKDFGFQKKKKNKQGFISISTSSLMDCLSNFSSDSFRDSSLEISSGISSETTPKLP